MVKEQRKQVEGVVVSDKMEKSIVVRVERSWRHPLYGKVVRTSKKYHAHDENNECHVGDTVVIEETRPLSRLKRWRVVKVLHVAAGVEDHAISEQDVAAQVPTKTTKTKETAPSA